MRPIVCDYLCNHTFRELENEHGVCARPATDRSKLSLNYDQYLAKSGDPLVEQCRGMVIRPCDDAWKLAQASDDSWKDVRVGNVSVLAWPLNRFYNHGDPAAAVVDWADAGLRVYEKVDGTMIALYWDDVKSSWFAATRSVCEADLPVHPNHRSIGNKTYSQLFLDALISTREAISGQAISWSVDGPDKVVHLNKELTYVFELVSPWNQVVVEYCEPRVFLLAARHTASGKEVRIDSIRMQHVQRPNVWQINDVGALAAFVDSAEPSRLEGAVVCDSRFNRQKVKNKAWTLASRAKDSVTASPRSALECIILGKVDDVAPIVPKEVAGRLHELSAAYGTYCRDVDAAFVKFMRECAGSRKRFAELVRESGGWSAPYFNLYDGKSRSVDEWLRTSLLNKRLSDTAVDRVLSSFSTVVNPSNEHVNIRDGIDGQGQEPS